jgi:hypothetical protein
LLEASRAIIFKKKKNYLNPVLLSLNLGSFPISATNKRGQVSAVAGRLHMVAFLVLDRAK